MAEIYPNGTIQFYNGIRLDNTYQNALSFANIAERENFFATTSHLKRTVQAQSYTRVTNGVCDVQIAIGDMYDVNYMRFQNSGFSSKWFYAFVKNVEYLNKISSRVYFEIDVLTTFYFDWGYLPSFVEREHVSDDTRGLHTLPEPFTIANLRPYDYRRHIYTQWDVFIAKAQEGSGAQEGKFHNGKHGALPQLVMYYGHKANTQAEMEDIQTWLATHTTDLDEVVSMFLYPSDLVAHREATVNWVDYWYMKQETITLPYPTAIDGYTPRNNKLLTYPYTYLALDNNEQANIYKFEDFNTPDIVFIVEGVPTTTPTITCAPVHYKGSSTNQCYEERLQMQQLPQLAFPIDSYKAWLAQTESTRQNKVISGALKGAAGGLTSGAALGSVVPGIGTAVGAVAGALLGGATGAVGGVISNAYNEAEAENLVNHVQGASQASNAIAGLHYGYIFKYMGIKAEQARVIDNFFDMFGYKVNLVKIPQIRTRAHWNYIKTNGCNMNQQNVPADYVARIKAIHDNGVTYWKNHDEIGNYNLNNYITG